MPAGQIAARVRRLNCLVEQPHDDVVLERPVTVLAEGRVASYHIDHRKADKPAKQHVVGDIPHQRAFASIECSTSKSHARISFSGAMLGRPPFASLSCMRANTGSMQSRAWFSEIRIGR
jgi:hypothetical protein